MTKTRNIFVNIHTGGVDFLTDKELKIYNQLEELLETTKTTKKCKKKHKK